MQHAIDVLNTVRAESEEFDAWLMERHAAIDKRRDHSYLGVDALLAGPINRATAYERLLSLFVDSFPCEDATSLRNAHAIIARLSENLRDSLESAETTAALRAVQRSIVNHKGPLELVDGRRELLAQAEVTSGVLKKKYVFQLQ